LPEGHKYTGKEFVWEAFEGDEGTVDGTLRLWTRWWGNYLDEDTLELTNRFYRREVHQCMRRVGL